MSYVYCVLDASLSLLIRDNFLYFSIIIFQTWIWCGKKVYVLVTLIFVLPRYYKSGYSLMLCSNVSTSSVCNRTQYATSSHFHCCSNRLIGEMKVLYSWRVVVKLVNVAWWVKSSVSYCIAIVFKCKKEYSTSWHWQLQKTGVFHPLTASSCIVW